jgi:FkbH-like protein
MKTAIIDLPWLIPPPDDFKARCASLNGDTPGGGPLRSLANHALNLNQITHLRKTMERVEDLSPLTPLRLATLSNGTTDFMIPAMAVSALRHGIAVQVANVPFGMVAQQAFDPNSELYRGNPDVVLLALDHRGLPLQDSADAALAYVKDLCRAITETCDALIIVQTLAPVPEPLFGNFDSLYDASTKARIEAFNAGLVRLVAGGPQVLLDAATIAATVGLDTWHDPVQWYLAKLPFAQTCLPLYADYVGRLLGAARGKSRRCLILDLDNTLWDGVIGDDGLDGIVLGQGDPAGEAFLAVQRMALALRDRGVILAVCSKNNDEVARQPFRDHPEMLLKEEQITVFQANWEDKASNIEAIAANLNLGLESLVFLDDNPAERAQVRAALPDVAVPEIPADPALYPRILAAAGYFDAITFSSEDSDRVAQYQANAKRQEVLVKARDLGDYLCSLNMVLTVKPFDSVARPRITQLINKSNQFNLTTRRYSEQQVAAFETNADIHTFQARLEDSFGDNGMISVVICRANDEVWEIDTWLMSCRVLGRRVEEALLNTIVKSAEKEGAKFLHGLYCPTPRNELVKDHFKKLGFEFAERKDDDTKIWRLDVSSFKSKDVPIRITLGRSI